MLVESVLHTHEWTGPDPGCVREREGDPRFSSLCVVLLYPMSTPPSGHRHRADEIRDLVCSVTNRTMLPEPGGNGRERERRQVARTFENERREGSRAGTFSFIHEDLDFPGRLPLMHRWRRSVKKPSAPITVLLEPRVTGSLFFFVVRGKRKGTPDSKHPPRKCGKANRDSVLLLFC